MRKQFEAGLPGLAVVLVAGCTAVQSLPAGHSSENVEVVHVAPPTGDRETDRASIHAAVEQVEPGGTIQFAPGTYLIGASIRIQVARLTLRGHPQGTTLRGCDPDEFATYVLSELSENCDGLRLLAGHQSVHDLTFEYAFTGLYLGLVWETGDHRAHRTEGGDRIMNNTFRTGKGVLLDGDWPEPSVIQNNRFINNYHAVNIFGATGHVLDNHFSVPEPERVPIAGFPDEAVRIFPRVREAGDTLPAVCGRNVVAGNRIEGALIGIEIRVREADTSCEGNVIRDNWIAVTPARVPEWSDYGAPDDSRIVYGVALALNDLAAEGSGAESDAAAPRISGNVIEGNRIIGGSGPAIQLYGAAGNRIVDNTITGVRLRETYPGHTLYFPPPGTDANGSGIWISHGSDDNEILGNTFEDIASYALVIEGDSNRVTVRDASDSVRDLGRGNRVSGPGGELAEAPGSSAAEPYEPPYEEKFVDAGGIHLHYLDFGGEGLPVVFLHSEGWNAHTYQDFAPRFTDRNRVLALTRRGYGESEGHGSGYDVPTQAESVLQFLDALGIERAVFAGNSSPTVHLTYLAEHHPDRVAGVIYLAGLLTHWLGEEVRESDPTGARAMAARASAPDTTARERLEALMSHRPEFLAGDRPPIEVPAIAFVGRSGTIGHERFSEPLALVGSALMADFFAELPPSPFRDYFQRLIDDPDFRSESLRAVEDSAAREFLRRLAEDTELQAQVWRYQMETARPAVLAGQDRFRRAFDDRLRLVRIEVSTVSGYEYRDSPELIEPHIRRFLDEVKSAVLTRQDSVVSWLADRAIPIHRVAAGSGFEDLQPLKETLRDVRVIGLGEATHGTHEFFRFKHRLFEFMVQEMGVRVLAFEGSQSAAENVVDPYVQGGPGDVESVVASLGLVGGWEEIRDLVAWMRAYNQSVAASERVQFVGFDIQYNDEARRIVLEYLRRVAPERVARTEALFQVPVDSLVYVPYLSRDTTAARLAADVAASALSGYRDLYEFVRAAEERFATRTSRAEAEHLLRHIRVLDQFAEVYGSLLAGSEAFNGLRDRYMAENIRRMLDAQPPGARAAVWAHNLHLMADSSLGNPRWMGQHLREAHGPAYYALALGLGEGTFMACDIDPDAQPYWALTRFESGPPREGTVDWYLTRAADRAGASQFFLDLRGAPSTGVVGEWLNEPQGMFVATSVYSPEWGASYASYPTSLATLFDGVAFFRTTTAARPLPLGDCPDRIYR